MEFFGGTKRLINDIIRSVLPTGSNHTMGRTRWATMWGHDVSYDLDEAMRFGYNIPWYNVLVGMVRSTISLMDIFGASLVFSNVAGSIIDNRSHSFTAITSFRDIRELGFSADKEFRKKIEGEYGFYDVDEYDDVRRMGIGPLVDQIDPDMKIGMFTFNGMPEIELLSVHTGMLLKDDIGAKRLSLSLCYRIEEDRRIFVMEV